ncbi:MAG: hypothetical protein AB7P40_21605 [Chloroflexota bacterium]
MKSRPTRSSAADPHAETRLRLLDLAEDASLYLRRHAEPSVRVAAALLLASSLAACSSSPEAPAANDGPPAVAPLAQEIKTGLPTSPGTYAVSPNSVTRDAQGVYGFTWRGLNGSDTWTQARSSLLLLAQGNEDRLVVGESGDPILRLKQDTPIAMPDEDGGAAGPTPTPGSGTSNSSTRSSSGSRSILWYPFYAGGTTSTGTGTGSSSSSGATTSSQTLAATTPAYRNPPAATPGQGSVRGSASSSVTPPSTTARTWVSPSRAARTGQAGGPGRGTAASSRSGSLSGPASGAARPGSSWFSGGKSGSSLGSSSS